MSEQTEPPIGSAVKPRSKAWIPIVIVVCSLVLVALLAGAATAVGSFVASRVGPSAPNQPLVTGPAPNAHAVQPVECDVACFDESSIEAAVLADSALEPLGFTKHDFPWGTYDPTTADALYRATKADWAANDGRPDQCVFVPTNSPAAIILDGTDEGSLDVVEFTGEHADEEVNNILDQSIRIFADSASAVLYLETLQTQIADCNQVSFEDGYSAEVTEAPALSINDRSAAVGWVRTGEPGAAWRAYVFDVQHGNLVVRIRLRTDGSISETEFRTLVEDYANQLAAIPVVAAP